MTEPRPGTVPSDLPAAAQVLSPDALDLLELALTGGASWFPPAGLPAGPVTLTDAENTPLAVVGVADDDGSPRAVRPFARAAGPHWDPALRRAAVEVRDDVRGGPDADAAVAVVVAEPPTRSEVDALPGLVGDAGPVLLLVPAARRSPAPGHVGAPGLVRVAGDLADRLDDAGRRATVVVVPWPADAPDGLRWPDVGARYGAARTEVLPAHRSPEARDRVAGLGTLWSDEVAALYPEAPAAEVARAAATARPRGAVVFFTGLSGSGKSTVARALAAELDDEGRHSTLLDGDEVRHHLSKGLGFDKASRELNVERIGYVASLVSSHGGVAVAAPIAPFASGRARVRALAEAAGAFLLVHVSTPLEVCEARDRKGLYAKARRGEIPEFTGISSPYEAPADADVVIDTSRVDVADAVAQVRAALDAVAG
ncbi:adenylyl-sulfate kinase [Krasilnikoviella flava]|uniref:Adenylyl-sulfate kinase n=1 Tax=Krasilnikoviella flava TaxID=526729 RepID=A0A1T5IA46_9MICO|nr:adenylyl-sulfate kinase [Krasilnikoviella flava]SKC35930.1 sulfate adenylyltransferase [Krasilnikoviella flava]